MDDRVDVFVRAPSELVDRHGNSGVKTSGRVVQSIELVRKPPAQAARRLPAPHRKAASGRRKESAKTVRRKRAVTASKKEGDQEGEPVSRKELLEKAFRVISNELGGEKRPTNTIGNLVQLLKIERSMKEDEEQPQEIRVIWAETPAEPIASSEKDTATL